MSDRVLLVGTGGFGRCWWPALAEFRDQLQVVAIVEPDDAARNEAARRFGLGSAGQLRPGEGDWSACGATVVIDSSPLWHHRSNAARAFAAGMDLLVAKPMAPTLAEARTMADQADRAGRQLAVAQQMRYFPCFLALRAALRDGLAGPPVSVRVRMALDGRGWTPGTEWRLRMAHPLLLEAGIHHFDLLRWCLSTEITDLAALEWNPPHSPFVGAASVAALLRTGDGVPVSYEATFAPGTEPAVRFDSGWTVVCRDGVLTVRDGGLFLDDKEILAPTPEPAPLETLNTELLRVWLRCRAEGRAVPFDGADNLRSMALVDRAIRWSTAATRTSVGAGAAS